MSEADYLTDRSHILIAGVTGARTKFGGKTSLATWWADTHGRASFDQVVFGNFKHDDAPERYADAVARTVEEVAGALGNGAEFVTLSPTNSDWELVSERLRALVDAMDPDKEKLVVLDESPELEPEALEWFARVAGNGASTKTLILSQAPGDLPMTVRRQCILCWVGPVSENNRHVFRSNNRENHFDAIREEHDPYEWSVLVGPDDDDRDYYEKVSEDYA